MNRRHFLTLSSTAAIGAAATPGGVVERRRERFDAGWQFTRGDAPGAEAPAFDASGWTPVTLPHDWAIEGPFDRNAPGGKANGFAPGGIGWYRKRFEARVAPGARTTIEFDGVYHNSEVWLNGHFLGRQAYGYSSFAFDVTAHLTGGVNVIAVRVDNSRQPNCRWYTGSGIYRHVWLATTGPLHVKRWGTYVTTPQVNRQAALVVVRTSIRNAGDSASNCVLETSIEGHGTRRTACSVPAGAERQLRQEFRITAPRLWSAGTPELYTASSRLLVDGHAADTYATPFGIREAVFSGAGGLRVNGQTVKLKGVCLHHDAGCLGAAVPDDALERRLRVLKSIGCNAIRTSHNPPAPELLDMADRLGFFVIDEAFDKWGGHTNPEFPAQWQNDLLAMLERDRNHPSVILWSVGNETGHPGSAKVNDTLVKLVDFVHRQEPSRQVTCALIPVNEDLPVEEKARRMASSSALMDVAGLNYSEQWYQRIHELLPAKTLLGTECYPYYRGDGANPQAFLAINPWFDVVRDAYVAGQFLWAGFDYLGESAGWPSKGWCTSPIDTCGFLKPGAHIHRCLWRPEEALVRLAVLDEGLDVETGRPHWSYPKMAEHWNWPERKGGIVRVAAISNCETVELLLNGRSLGTRRIVDNSNSMIVWEVPYEEGRIEAIGRRGESIAARHELRTAGAPVAISLKPDREAVAADGQALVHVEVGLVDAAGIAVKHTDRKITFSVDGPLSIAGVDNGDLRSMESYQGPGRTTYFGRALVVLRAGFESGRATLAAAAGGLKVASVTIPVQAPKPRA